MMHRNESVFPLPDKFYPERWVDPVAARTLDKHLVAFGKGSRQCVGMPYVSILIPQSWDFIDSCV
jgi:cytochrome P450